MSPSASMRRATASPSQRTRVALLLVIVAAFALYLLGNNSVHLWERDEPRYAECSREMLRTGDYVIPRLLGAWRFEKPPIIYWLQAGCMKVLGQTAFAARLPSSLAMTILLVLLSALIWKYLSPKRAFWTAFVFATTFLLIYDAKMCLTDSVLLLFISLTQLGLLAVYRGNRSWRITLGLWSALGCALMTKGPIALAVVLMTLITLGAIDWAMANPPKRGASFLDVVRRLAMSIPLGIALSARGWWRHTRPLVGIVILAAVVAPWLIAAHYCAPGFLAAMFDIARQHIATPMEQHGGPPGWHAAAVWVFFMPWSLLLPATLIFAWRDLHHPILRYALAAVLGPWITVECMTTKLPHYLLPAYPGLTFLTANALLHIFRLVRHRRGAAMLKWIKPVMTGFAIVCAVMAIAPWLPTRWSPLAMFPKLVSPDTLEKLSDGLPRALYVAAIAFSALAVAYALTLVVLFWRNRFALGLRVLGIGFVALIAIAYGLYLPSARFFRLPQRLATVLIDHGATRPGDVVMIEYKEDGLPFYQGGNVSVEEKFSYLRRPHAYTELPNWLVIPRGMWDSALAQNKAQYHPVATLSGYNYAGRIEGKSVIDVMVLQKKPRDGEGEASAR